MSMRWKTLLIPLLFLALFGVGHAQSASGSAAAPISVDAVVKFMNDFDRLGDRKDFGLWSDMIHEKVTYRLNDGDFVGKTAVKGIIERTWATYRSVENARFYITDIQVIHTDTTSASASFVYHWEWTQDGRAQKAQGRGTRILLLDQGRLQVIYMHLSPMPTQMLIRATAVPATKQ